MSKEILETNESRELSLYAVNDYATYSQAIQPVVRCLVKKAKADTFNYDKAQKAFYNVATYAAKKYAADFGGVYYRMFSAANRRLTAAYLLDYYMDEIDDGFAGIR